MKRLIFIILLLNYLQAFSTPITVGVIKSAPPFSEMSETAQGPIFFGFSIDIMNSICQKIKQQCVYSPLTLDQQFTALDNGTVDLLLLANPYNSSDLSEYTVSLPYALSKIHFVALESSPLTQLSDITNKKIGVIKTTFYDLLMNSPYKTGNTILTFTTVADLITALMQKKVDVILLNNAIAYYFINNNLYDLKIIGKEVPMGSGYGIIALPNHAELIVQINKAILSMQADGTYIAIYQKYYNPS
jgi:ABC-type amino acid transport substrate-binding protein